MIHACRIRLGESQKKFARRVGEMNGTPEFGTGPTCFFWEKDMRLPVGHLHNTGATLYEAIVKSMKSADIAENGLGLSIPTPWFDAAKEATFRDAFSLVVQKANDAGGNFSLPGRLPIDCPTNIIPLHLSQYDGRLNPALVNGQQKKP